MNNHEPALIVVTGIMAAGKSTIARLLAQHFARGVHIEADALQRMIVSERTHKNCSDQATNSTRRD